MAGDAPEAGAVGFGVEVDGCLAPQHLEHLVVATGLEHIWIEQVDVTELHAGIPLVVGRLGENGF